MNIFVLIDFTVTCIVKPIRRKSHARNLKYWRLIHINPKTVVWVCSFKEIRFHQRVPKLLSISIQKVNPVWLTRPALTHVWFSIIVFYPNACEIIFKIKLFRRVCTIFMEEMLLLLKRPEFIDRVNTFRSYMRICNDDEATFLTKYLIVHVL
jgi:hypothetical protein